ncbi:MAG: alpha/beta hydrolase [Candidatus Roizmanbacteria bacterium]
MNKKLKIKNIFGENLDILLEGNEKSDQIIIFIHGYGTDKNEGFTSYLDLSRYLRKEYFIIRFDQSSYGKSEGEQYEFQFQKAAGDLDSIIRYAKKQYPDKTRNLIAHSLGTFIVSLLSPYEIRKTVFTSIVNSNTKYASRELEKRIRAKGGIVKKDGITVYIRSRGVQLIGKDFWKTLENLDPISYIEELATKTQLAIFKPMQDDVLKNKYFDEYKKIKGIEYHEVNGDHNFKNPKDREALFEEIKAFLIR